MYRLVVQGVCHIFKAAFLGTAIHTLLQRRCNAADVGGFRVPFDLPILSKPG